MDQVRIGFVGCGNLSTRMLYPSIAKIPELDLVACCDLKEELAKRNARAFGARRHYTDVEKMLASEELDAALVVGPPQMHKAVGSIVMGHGLHLYTEKPIALTIDEAREMVALGDEKGVFTQVGHMMRHAAPVQAAKRLVESPDFGKITFVESKYFTGPSVGAWGVEDAAWCYMLVQAIHPTDLARHFGGDIVRVCATECHGEGHRGAYSVAVEFASGAAGFLNLNGSFPGWNTGLEVTGDKGAFVGIDNMRELRYMGPDAWLSRDDTVGVGQTSYAWDSVGADSGEARMGYHGEMLHFAKSILAGTPPYPSHRDALKAMLVCQAILESVERRESVDVLQE